jgi:hypothetical protein
LKEIILQLMGQIIDQRVILLVEVEIVLKLKAIFKTLTGKINIRMQTGSLQPIFLQQLQLLEEISGIKVIKKRDMLMLN